MEIGTKAISGLAVIPVRSSPSDACEMTTQLLFGELVTILEQEHQWIKIKIQHDDYEGWVDEKQILPISDKDVPHLLDLPRQQVPFTELFTPWGNQTILQGSPILSQDDSFVISHHPFHWKDEVPSIHQNDISILINSYMNAPYLWGGRTKFGIDCSGLTQTLFHQLSINIHRDASQQVLQGKSIPFAAKKEGDLAFFTSEGKDKISHVGVVLPHNKIVHAHGRVRIDELHEEGIFNAKEKKYSHQFSCVNRYLNL